jgi:phospholipid/cholesterol/gamma-HCH transport system substrate-binding protein
VKISNETKVGIITTVAIVIVILGLNFLKGKNVFSSNIIMYAKYKDAAGLSASNPVMLYGLKAGQVDDIKYIQEGDYRILVKFHIKGDIDLPNDSKAKIFAADLLGSKAIDLVPGKSTVMVKKNDTLDGYIELSLTESLSKTVAPVKDKVEKLISSVDTAVTTLNSVFNEKELKASFASIRSSLKNLEGTTASLNDMVSPQNGKIRVILDNLDKITANIKNNGGAITHAIDNFSSISDSLRAIHLKETIDQVNNAVGSVNSILAKAQRGEGTLGKLLNDDRLYNNVISASRNLDRLIYDLKKNPSRYLRFSVIRIGKKDKAPAEYQMDTTAVPK